MGNRVSIAQTRIARAPVILKATGLGSCVALGLYDPQNRIGGLSHMLLPSCPEDSQDGGAAKYVDLGIMEMVEELERAGARRDALVAKIVGGANMFEPTHQTLINGIGARNARSARETLARLGIPLISAEVGGNRGRTVEFDLATGKMLVYCAGNDERISL